MARPANPDLPARLERVRRLAREIHHIALSTTNSDGSPLCTPVFAVLDEAFRAIWSSHPESMHSRNIARDDRAFFVIYDSREGHGGLYVQAKARALPDGRELEQAYQIYASMPDHPVGPAKDYSPGGPQRLYEAAPLRFWTNQSDRNSDGVIVRDRRVEISLKDLVQGA